MLFSLTINDLGTGFRAWRSHSHLSEILLLINYCAISQALENFSFLQIGVRIMISFYYRFSIWRLDVIDLKHSFVD
jgi:hypothetical protein